MHFQDPKFRYSGKSTPGITQRNKQNNNNEIETASKFTFAEKVELLGFFVFVFSMLSARYEGVCYCFFLCCNMQVCLSYTMGHDIADPWDLKINSSLCEVLML